MALGEFMPPGPVATVNGYSSGGWFQPVPWGTLPWDTQTIGGTLPNQQITIAPNTYFPLRNESQEEMQRRVEEFWKSIAGAPEVAPLAKKLAAPEPPEAPLSKNGRCIRLDQDDE